MIRDTYTVQCDHAGCQSYAQLDPRTQKDDVPAALYVRGWGVAKDHTKHFCPAHRADAKNPPAEFVTRDEGDE